MSIQCTKLEYTRVKVLSNVKLKVQPNESKYAALNQHNNEKKTHNQKQHLGLPISISTKQHKRALNLKKVIETPVTLTDQEEPKQIKAAFTWRAYFRTLVRRDTDT